MFFPPFACTIFPNKFFSSRGHLNVSETVGQAGHTGQDFRPRGRRRGRFSENSPFFPRRFVFRVADSRFSFKVLIDRCSRQAEKFPSILVALCSGGKIERKILLFPLVCECVCVPPERVTGNVPAEVLTNP